jgi:hypothetical protein
MRLSPVLRSFFLLFCWAGVSLAQSGPAKDKEKEAPAEAKKFEDFDTLTKGAKESEGLFRLHLKDDRLLAEIRPDQFDKPMLLPVAISRGAGLGGHTLNFDEQWVVYFHRVGDRVHLVRRNVRFQAKPGSPAALAVATTYTDSILLAIKILSIHPGRQSVLISLNDIFMTDLAQAGLGQFDPGRSNWSKIKVFPRNIELEVMATYTGRSNDDSVIDRRGNTVVIHYGLTPLPESGYQPRVADDRVGHFLTVVKDFSSDSTDSSFVRYANRWRLERAEPFDPKNPGKLSAPKKKIIFWIERSVPEEYRASVREGILEWNKAFEKVGFRDAIEVRQQESEEFDPEDINYNTFRWITTDQGYAMGPSRANPLTGEILDADIIFDASMVRFWRQEYQIAGSAPASSIQALRQGQNLNRLPHAAEAPMANGPGWNDSAQQRLVHLAARHGLCQCTSHMKQELGLGALALAAAGQILPGDKVPDELLQQAIKETVMHEVGHTLGLRHNFKASAMLKNEQLHDTSITRKQGLVASVMDYSPINIAPKGVKQGDYFTTTLGPYDYLAIEYAYRPLVGGTEGEQAALREIARQASKLGIDYATDEDLSNSDPKVNLWDLGADPLRFAQDRMAMAEQLFKELAAKASAPGDGYQRVRQAFSMLLNQYGNGAFLAASFVGGEYYHRDHREDPNARDPMVPVEFAKQREALRFLQEKILSDQAFRFDPALLRKLGADRWYHWGNEFAVESGVDYPLHARILNIQRVALYQLTSAQVLARLQDSATKVDPQTNPLRMAEVFRALSDGVWGDLPTKDGKGKTPSDIRRNLQREYLQVLSNLALGRGGRSMPPDARSLARLHLKEIRQKLADALASPQIAKDDTVRAHLDECHDRVTKVLNASIQAES